MPLAGGAAAAAGGRARAGRHFRRAQLDHAGAGDVQGERRRRGSRSAVQDARPAKRGARRWSTSTADRRGRCCSAGTTWTTTPTTTPRISTSPAAGSSCSSVNYRLGIGYGHAFQFPENAGAARRVGVSRRPRRRRSILQSAQRRRCEADRHLGRVVRRLPDGARARPQLRHLRRRRGHSRRAQLGSPGTRRRRT